MPDEYPLAEINRQIEERELFLKDATEHQKDYPLSDPDPGPVEQASGELEQLYAERSKMQQEALRHISEIDPKTVENIIEEWDPENTGRFGGFPTDSPSVRYFQYEQCILDAAYFMKVHSLTDWTYHTQYASGTTVWHSPTANGELYVKAGGESFQ